MAVCLHCLHADRVAARDRRQRAILRFTAWTLGVAVVGIVGAAGANAVGRHPEPTRSTRAASKRVAPATTVHDSIAPAATAPAIQLQGTPAIATPTADSATHALPIAAVAAAPATVVVDSTPAPTPLIGPIIPQGRTDLPDSLFAVRRGDTVVVNFDTGPARTRRADKFDVLVRQTLHTVYGAVADTLLAAVPIGKLVTASELVTALPKRGIHLQGAHGPRLALWPVTRPGRDGLLVVAYRTLIER